MIGLSDEWVIGWNRVRIAVIDIDANQRCENRVEILTVAERIASAAAVTEAGVEHPVGAERKESAVVVVVGRVGRSDDHLRRRRIRDVRVRRREPLYVDVAVGLGGEIDVEEVIGRVLGVERDTQEPALTAAKYPAADVEEGSRLHRAVLDDADAAGLLDDEDPPVVERLGHEDRSRET